MERRSWVLVLLLALSTGLPTPAAAAAWTYASGPARLLLGDGDEDVQFLAECEAGALSIIYMAPDRAEIRSGTKKACDGLRPCREKLEATLLVDGQGTTVEARAQPEEMYGGYEIHFTLSPKAPFWTQMARGRTLSLKVDGKEGEKLSLKGVAKPLTRLLAACQR